MRGKAGLFSRRALPQPAFSSVVALLHLEGPDGIFATADSSSFAIPVFFTAAPMITTAQKRFGESSLALNGVVNQRVFLSPSQTVGTNDLTLEFWARFSAVPTTEVVLARWASGFEIRLSDSLYVARVSTTPFSLSTYSTAAPWVPSLNVWYHFAVCRSGRFMRLFVDGVQLGNTVDLGEGFSFPSGNQQFGGTNGLPAITGFYDEIRVSIVDHYSANAPFTPPSEPFPDSGLPAVDPSFASVSMLLHMDGAGSSFVDSSGTPKTITASGNATQSTARSKFGGKSALFGGASDYLSAASNAAFGFGTGDFTIEAWIYPVSDSTNNTIVSVGTHADGVLFRVAGDGTLAGSLYIAGESHSWNPSRDRTPLNTWTHVAVVRQGSDVRVYANGALCYGSSGGAGGNVGSSQGVTVGQATHAIGTGAAAANFFDGYIDDLRITKGVARYQGTSSFPPPTAPFPDA